MKSVFKNKEERYQVGRMIATLLRHDAPNLFTVDPYGYIDIDALLSTMQRQGFDITIDHIVEVVSKDAQKRFEIFRGKIRAKAGHSFPVLPTSDDTIPPEFLYHGTSVKAANQILETGILGMGKTYVHLASTIERARRVGLRKSNTPVILKIKAQSAHAYGVRFWKSGQIAPDGEIFLSDAIPPRFIDLIHDQYL